MNESDKKVIRNLLADEIMGLSVSLILVKQREEAYWSLCDPGTTADDTYFKGLNATRNDRRYYESKLRKLRSAAKAIKSC